MTIWLRRAFWLALGATGLCLAAATWFYTVGRLEGGDTPFHQVVLFMAPFWYLWAAYTPVVIGMARRHPFRRDRLLASLARHAALLAVLAFAHSALRYGLQPQLRASLTEGSTVDLPFGPLLGFATYEAPVHVFIYGAILLGTYMVVYLRRLRERELATAQLSAQLARAQVQALRMQLNPHFLFNALNGVAMLVRDGAREQAVRMLAGLGDLLRYVLDESDEPEVPLVREIEFIEQYLEIEQTRFSDRLEVRIEVDPGAAEAWVPSLLLQPLVENAVQHGIARSPGASAITVTAGRDSGALRLRVVDDGPGFELDAERRAGHGMGLENTRTRLRQLYGDDHSLVLENVSPRGASVTVTLPYRAVPSDDGEG